jgi:glycosyltransferase involved in cell wall biosynthesis
MPEKNDHKNPLVTFVIFAYNQEDYIRAAIEGALSQTYEPLEILLSDDCSTDRTFSIMQEMAATYEGPHSVRVRRSCANLGLLAHMNEAVNDVYSDFIVVAAGDDISMPLRTERLMMTFLSSKRVYAVLSRVIRNENYVGVLPKLSEYAKRISLYEIAACGGGIRAGASYAYRRECFLWPGPLPEKLYSEDRILPLRAAILGEVLFIPEELVFYRTSESQGRPTLTSKGMETLAIKANLESVSAHLSRARNEGRISSTELHKFKIGMRLLALFRRMKFWDGVLIHDKIIRAGGMFGLNLFNKTFIWSRELVRIRSINVKS